MNRIKKRYLTRRKNRRSEGTYREDKTAIKKLEKYLNRYELEYDELEFEDADFFLDWLQESERLSELSSYGYFGSVRLFYDHLRKTDHIESNPFREVDTSHIDWRDRQNKKPSLSPEEIKALVESTDTVRAKALFSFMASTGVRLGEAVTTKLDDVDLTDRKAIVPTFKNPYEDTRPVYFDRRTRRILREYIDQGYRTKYASEDTGYLFLSADYGQFENDGHLSKDRARKDFVRAVENCDEIQDRVEFTEQADGSVRCSVTTHILRRSFSQVWVDNGGDIMSLKSHQGWENLETAQQYLEDEVDKEKRDNYGVQL